MTSFKFRLESALRLRHLVTESARNRLQELIAQQKRLENSLAALDDERAQAVSFVRSANEPGAQDLRALSLFSLGLQGRRKALEEAIADMAAQIAEQKYRLLAAERDERSVLKLRDRRFAEWNLKVTREIEATSQELWLLTHTTSMEP
jgi:flagellar export protein FliJ